MIHTWQRSTKQDVEEFLKEVSVLSMIRHENVVLFMGACLEPPNLAVITRYVTRRLEFSPESYLSLKERS